MIFLSLFVLAGKEPGQARVVNQGTLRQHLRDKLSLALAALLTRLEYGHKIPLSDIGTK